jgi:hypothetical protein
VTLCLSEYRSGSSLTPVDRLLQASVHRPLRPVASPQLNDRCRAGCRRLGSTPPEWPLSSAAKDGTRPPAVIQPCKFSARKPTIVMCSSRHKPASKISRKRMFNVDDARAAIANSLDGRFAGRDGYVSLLDALFTGDLACLFLNCRFLSVFTYPMPSTTFPAYSSPVTMLVLPQFLRQSSRMTIFHGSQQPCCL